MKTSNPSRGRENGKGNARFGQEARDDQPLSLDANHGASGRVILPHIHAFLSIAFVEGELPAGG